MRELKFTDFWKELDVMQRNRLRILCVQKTECSPATVDKYGVGFRVPNPYRKAKIRDLVRKNFNTIVTF